MKLLLATALTLLLVIDPASSAEIKPEARSFDAFWIQFKAAVARDDKEAVVAATDLRFFNQNKHPKHVAKAAFIRDYPSYFTKEVKKCFATAKPVLNRDSYSVFCGEEIFEFAKRDGEYRFTYIGMND